ncbi:MAG: glycosyltransferase family 2 protein [Candidatus Omnitrophota bacterium]
MIIDVLVPATRASMAVKCLLSLAGQQRRPDTVVVIMQRRDTKTQEAVQDFIKRGSLNVAAVLVEAPGIIDATNAGLKVCCGDIICFIDDDARAKKDWIQRIEAYYADEKIGGVGGRDIVYFGDKIDEKPVKKVGQVTWCGRVIGNHHHIVKMPKRVTHLKGCNMSYRRKLLFPLDKNLKTQIEMPEPEWELDIGLSISMRGYKIIYDPNILVEHYPASSTYNRNMRKSISVRNQTYVLLKHFPLCRKIIYIIFAFLIGQRSRPGILQFIIELLSLKGAETSWLELVASLKDKSKGFKVYTKSLNDAR